MPSPLPDLTSVYEVTIAGQSMDRSWLLPRNPPVLLGAADRPDSSIKIPRAHGVLNRPATLGGYSETLFVIVTGDYTTSGAAATDPVATLVDNIVWLQSNVFGAATDSEGTVALSVVDPAGATWAGRIALKGFDQGETSRPEGRLQRICALRFLIPRPLVRTP